jgi:hypothetical protein
MEKKKKAPAKPKPKKKKELTEEQLKVRIIKVQEILKHLVKTRLIIISAIPSESDIDRVVEAYDGILSIIRSKAPRK